jgi:ATP-dependent Lhr-like helicase
LRGNGNAFLDPPSQGAEVLLSIAARRVLEYIRKHGASFLTDIRTGTQLSLDGLNKGFAELFWAGIITNDLFAELQNVKPLPRIESEVPVERIEILDPRHNPRKAKLMHTVRKALKQVPGWSGRWSLVHLHSVLGDELSIEERSHQQAWQLLERYGVVAKEFHRREDLLPWALIAAVLNRMEMRGEIRRGYFIEGLSGMQFALPVVVEELRRLRREKSCESALVLVNACDPANPYGPLINLSHNIRSAEELRFARIPSNYIVFQRGAPVLLIENYGRRLWTLAERKEEILISALRIFLGVLQLPPNLRPVKSITIEHWDGIRPAQSPLEPALRSLGFTRDRNQTMIHERYV